MSTSWLMPDGSIRMEAGQPGPHDAVRQLSDAELMELRTAGYGDAARPAATHTKTYVSVYVVCMGERGEGHSPYAIRSTADGAIQYAEKRWGAITNGTWRVQENGDLLMLLPSNVDEVVIKKMWVDRED